MRLCNLFRGKRGIFFAPCNNKKGWDCHAPFGRLSACIRRYARDENKKRGRAAFSGKREVAIIWEQSPEKK